jgi:hypothetical protein
MTFCPGTPKWESRNWEPIILSANLGLRWGLKKSCSLRRKLFNDMLHATYTQGNWVDSRLLMVWNQSANLTPDLSFGYNLCFRCPNGSCKPILTYVFQYLFNDINNSSIHWVFTPAITFWTFKSPPRLQLRKWEFPWECEGLFPHTLLHSREHAAWLPSFPLGPQPCNPLPWSQAQG